MRFFSGAANIGPLRTWRPRRRGSLWLLAHDEPGMIVGHAVYVSSSATRAEVAVEVADHLHGRGLGTILIERLAAVAEQRGITHFVAEVLCENRAMLDVFREGFDARVVRREGPRGASRVPHLRLAARARALRPKRSNGGIGADVLQGSRWLRRQRPWTGRAHAGSGAHGAGGGSDRLLRPSPSAAVGSHRRYGADHRPHVGAGERRAGHANVEGRSHRSPMFLAGESLAKTLQCAAISEQADLVVLGSSHRGALGRVLLGSVAQATLREAPCPVAVAPVGSHADRTEARLTHITVAATRSSRRRMRCLPLSDYANRLVPSCCSSRSRGTPLSLTRRGRRCPTPRSPRPDCAPQSRASPRRYPACPRPFRLPGTSAMVTQRRSCSRSRMTQICCSSGLMAAAS